MYGPDLVFVHRDAEGRTYEERVVEIPAGERIVPVVPVRMTEAWLLIDEPMLRRAADNPHGHEPLDMPPVARLESLPAKKELHDRLRLASGRTGRRIRKFDVDRAVARLAELIDDYSPLLLLPAFVAFRCRLREALARIGRL